MQNQSQIKPFSCVVAYCRQNQGIGANGGLPWPMIKADMKHFAKVTSSTESFALSAVDSAQNALAFNSILKNKLQKPESEAKINAVIMGRKTWESIPESKRPLKDRLNVVLTSKPEEFRAQFGDQLIPENLVVFSDFENALTSLSADEKINEIFVIGGSSLYNMAMDQYKKHCKLILATRINKKFECDTFIQNLETSADFCPIHISQTYSQGDITFDYAFFGNTDLLAQKPDLVPTKLMSVYPPHAEYQYLEIISDVIQNGKYKDDRTGTGIYTKFGAQMRFDLSQSFPVLTTKDVFWRGLAEELTWFIRGETNAKLLSDKKIRIWDGNASREFLDNLGLKDREEWDLGPVYGF